MALADTQFYKTFKKYEQLIMALEGILIIILLLFVWNYAYKDFNLKTEINQNCGWGEDDYYCFCERSEAMAIKNKIDSGETGGLNLYGVDNVSLVG